VFSEDNKIKALCTKKALNYDVIYLWVSIISICTARHTITSERL